MQHYTRKLLTEWRRLGFPFADESAVIAVSGGADSISLAFALAELVKAKKLDMKFTVAHYNHGLRGRKSNADEAFVKDMAKRLGFAFMRGTANNLRASTANLEEHAREERYRFLEKAAKKVKASMILTAHTLDDQAETFLLRLLRGSGADGLGAMRMKRDLAPGSNIMLARPLLTWAYRKDTVRFCEKHGIDYRYDEMNEDERFQRVKVRKKLLPVLKEFNPKIISLLAQTAALMHEDSEALNQISGALLATIMKTKGRLSIKGLLEVPENLRLRVLRLWLGQEAKGLRQIDSAHIEAIYSLATSRKSGRLAELPGGNYVIKEDGKLVFGKTKVEKTLSAN